MMAKNWIQIRCTKLRIYVCVCVLNYNPPFYLNKWFPTFRNPWTTGIKVEIDVDHMQPSIPLHTKNTIKFGSSWGEWLARWWKCQLWVVHFCPLWCSMSKCLLSERSPMDYWRGWRMDHTSATSGGNWRCQTLGKMVEVIKSAPPHRPQRPFLRVL